VKVGATAERRGRNCRHAPRDATTTNGTEPAMILALALGGTLGLRQWLLSRPCAVGRQRVECERSAATAAAPRSLETTLRPLLDDLGWLTGGYLRRSDLPATCNDEWRWTVRY